MTNCTVTLFPRKDCGTRSQKLHVKCNEYLMVEGYGVPEGVCVQFWKIDEDKCNCDYAEKPFCIQGDQLGLDHNCTTALLTMPGCYVAYICGADSDDIEDDFKIRAERVKCLDNLAVTLQGTTLGA